MSNKQAEAAAARADQLHKEVYGPKTGSETEVVVETIEAQSSEPTVKSDTPVAGPEVNEWETKFKVLQGKYNAEVPRLSRELREAGTEIRTMQTKLEALEKAPVETPVVDVHSINPEDFADYGDEFQQLATTVTSLQNMVETLRTENTQLKNSVDSVETTHINVAQKNFYDEMDRAVPEWNTINTNPDFIAWLQDVDQISGRTRQAHLDSAADSLDATKAISIFKAFNGSTPVATKTVPDERIARQAQPDSVAVSSATTPQKRTYTRNEIKQFYKDVSQGKWKGYEDELKVVEADIFAAPMEGRVIG